MGAAFFIMAILGCADSEASCQQVRVTETHYASESACNEAMSSALYQNSDIAYPVVMAQCRASNRDMAAAEGKAGA